MIQIYESENPSNSIETVLEKPNLPAVVVFYRSQQNTLDKYGKKDSQYHGEFGFDRFENDIMATGQASNYKKLEGVETKKDTTDSSHDYLCPYLSLFPPNGEGYMDTATLYVKLEKDLNRSDGDPNIGGIFFKSSDPCSIEIAGTQEHKVRKKTIEAKKIVLEMGDNPQAISIKCLQSFSEEITITASTSKGDVIGQLIVFPNQMIYELTIQPILIKLGSQTDSAKIDLASASVPEVKVADLEKKLNNNSLNQALIKCTVATHTHQFMVSKSQVSSYLSFNSNGNTYLYKNNMQRAHFNGTIEKQYAIILSDSNLADERTKINKAFMDSGTYKAILDFYHKFDKHFHYKKDASNKFSEAKKAFDNSKVTKAWDHKKVQKEYVHFKTAEQKMKNMLTQWGIDPNDTESKKTFGLCKKGVVHVFYYPDIEAAYASTTETLDTGYVPGYTHVGGGVSHIFKSGFSMVDAIVHEIGHAMGLPHTFDESLGKTKDPSIKTKNDFEKEIEELEDKLEKLEEQKKEFDKGMKEMNKHDITDLQVYLQYTSLGDAYESVKSAVDGHKMHFQTKTIKTYNIFNKMLERMKEIQLVESDMDNIKDANFGANILDVNILKGDILAKKQALGILKKAQSNAPKEKKGDPKYQGQSDTVENYMDYNFNKYGEVKSNFERKVLTKQQWDLIRETGVKKEYLQE